MNPHINNSSSGSLSSLSSSGHSFVADDSPDQSVGDFDEHSLTPVHDDQAPALRGSLIRGSTSMANLADFSTATATSSFHHTSPLQGRMSQVSSSQAERLPEQLNHAFGQLRAIRNRLSGNNSTVPRQEIALFTTRVRTILTDTTIQYSSTLHDASEDATGAVSNANELIHTIDHSDPAALLDTLETALGHVRITIEQQSATAVDATMHHHPSPLEHGLAHAEALLANFSGSQDLQPEALQELTHDTQHVNEEARALLATIIDQNDTLETLFTDSMNIQQMLETPGKGTYDLSYQERSLAILRPALANLRQAVEALSTTSTLGERSVMDQAASHHQDHMIGDAEFHDDDASNDWEQFVSLGTPSSAGTLSTQSSQHTSEGRTTEEDIDPHLPHNNDNFNFGDQGEDG